MFDVEALLAELVAATSESDPRGAAKEIVAKTMTSPGEVSEALAPRAGGISLLHHSPDLTVITLRQPPF